MILDKTKYYENKTRRFLLPCLRAYGDHFVNMLSHMSKMAVGINDQHLKDFKLGDRYIFVLIDKGTSDSQYERFQNYCREHESYVTDYSFGPSIDSDEKMFVYKIPQKFEYAYDKFIQGKYSEMFEPKEIEVLFKGKLVETQILTKDPHAMYNLVQSIHKEFGTDVETPTENIIEYELPINKAEEMFNYIVS